MKVAGWRAWYTEGRTYDSKNTNWKALPKDGVLKILLFMNERDKRTKMPYRRGMMGDYYWFVPDDEVYGCCYHDEMGPSEILKRYPGALLLRGKWTSDEEMARITKETLETRFL